MGYRGRFPADDALAFRLAAGDTVRAAAASAGVSEKTAYRRNRNPLFRALVQDLRAGMVRDAAGVLTHAMTAAARTLVELLAHEDANVRHKAAVSLLTAAAKLRETVEFDERLAALEGGDDADGDANSEPPPRVYLPPVAPEPADDEDRLGNPKNAGYTLKIIEKVVEARGANGPAEAAG
jgi:hypothetical protein